MEVRLLGPVEVMNSGRNIAPTAPKPRQVLALMLLRRNTVVRTDELIDELWEENPPASAMTTLQTYIYKLRKLLANDGPGDILQTHPGGYLFTIPDSCVDQQSFEENSRAGQTLLENGDLARASEVLGNALALWRGPTLVDVVQGSLLSSYATRLEELRFRTHEMRIEADLRLGRHRELISELRSLIVTHPLDEHLRSTLMIALHRSGRRHEALEAYRSLRGSMIEELGLEPSPELRELHEALLSDSPIGPSPVDVAEAAPTAAVVLNGHDDRAVALRGASAEPSEPSAVAEPEPAGELPAIVSNEAPGDLPVVRTAATGLAPPAQLPPDLPDFTGHTALLDEITSGFLVEDIAGAVSTATPLVVVSGMPGVGKSAFAIHLAHLLKDRFPDGQLYARLRDPNGGRSESEPLRAFLRALGVAEPLMPDTAEERCALFRSVTAGRRLLIVLDDAAFPSEVTPLLPGDPRCALIVATRRRMPELIGRYVDLDALDPAESREMLMRAIGHSRLDQEPQAADRLVQLSGGLPLALRCIGGRLAAMRDFPLAEMAEQLSSPAQRLDLLRLGELDVRSRFDRSYRRLGRQEQGLYRLLSMLPANEFTAAAATDLLGWDEAIVARVARSLERLVDHHLIRMHCAAGNIRYTFPLLALDYARERLASTLAAGEHAGP